MLRSFYPDCYVAAAINVFIVKDNLTHLCSHTFIAYRYQTEHVIYTKVVTLIIFLLSFNKLYVMHSQIAAGTFCTFMITAEQISVNILRQCSRGCPRHADSHPRVTWIKLSHYFSESSVYLIQPHSTVY